MEAHCILFTRPMTVDLGDFELPRPGPGQLIIQSRYTCISPGTELRRLRGKESIGAIEFPFIPGYCQAGEVLESGPGTALTPGDRVISCGTIDGGGFGLAEGGHVSHTLANEEAVAKVPDGVDYLDASVAILAGIAYHGLRLSRPLAGERVVVVGLGVIGQLAARLHTACGAEVLGCDVSDHRVRSARAAGVAAVVAGDDLRLIRREYFPDGADLVVDATGNPAVIGSALGLLCNPPWNPRRDSPVTRYLVLGSYEGNFCIPYEAAYAAQASILVPKGSQAGDWSTAMRLIATSKLVVRDLATEVRSPQDAARTYEELSSRDCRLLTAAFRWNV